MKELKLALRTFCADTRAIEAHSLAPLYFAGEIGLDKPLGQLAAGVAAILVTNVAYETYRDDVLPQAVKAAIGAYSALMGTAAYMLGQADNGVLDVAGGSVCGITKSVRRIARDTRILKGVK